MQKRVRIILCQLWVVIGLSVFGLMLLHQSVPPTILGRYSNSYALSLVIVLATIVLALFGWWLAIQEKLLARLPKSRALAWAMMLLCLVFIILFWLYAPGASFLPAIALFRVYIVTLASGITMFYLAHTQSDDLPKYSASILLIIGVMLAIVLTAIYLGRVPESRYWDEPLVAGYGWTCSEDTVMGIDMLPPRDTPYLAVAVPIAYCIPGYLMRWFGTTLTVARSFGIVSVWLAIPFVYGTAKRLFGDLEAVMSALIVMLFALSHNFLRSDPYATLALAIALWAYIRSKDNPALWQHFVVGFFLATIIEGHQLAIRFIPIFVLLYLWQYVTVLRENKRWVWHTPFFAFALGGLSYLPIFYVVHVIWWGKTDLFTMIELLQVGYDEQLTVGGDVSFWQRIRDNLSQWFTLYPVRHPTEVMILFVGLITAFWRRTAIDRLLVFIFGLSFVLYILIAPKPTVYYWVHHLPIVALLGAGFIHTLRSNQQTIRLIAIFPILVVMVFQTAHYIKAGQTTQNADHIMQISFDIDAHLPDDIDVITGHQVYFYGLAYRTFFDSNTYSKHTIPEARAEFGIDPPQAIIWTRGLDEHPSLASYIETQAMVAVRCYPTIFFSRETVLYVLPEFADEVVREGCR